MVRRPQIFLQHILITQYRCRPYWIILCLSSLSSKIWPAPLRRHCWTICPLAGWPLEWCKCWWDPRTICQRHRVWTIWIPQNHDRLFDGYHCLYIHKLLCSKCANSPNWRDSSRHSTGRFPNSDGNICLWGLPSRSKSLFNDVCQLVLGYWTIHCLRCEFTRNVNNFN